jgi:hypothetical protein
MAVFPDPAPDCYRYRDGHSDGDDYSLTTPALAHAAAAHGNSYTHAHDDPPAIRHTVTDTISNPGSSYRPVGDDPPAGCF